MNTKDLDSNLSLVAKIFKKNKIHYWLCHGTLLGIIRDKKIMEWDDDIDIAVWETDISRDRLIKIMNLNDFKLQTDTFFEDDNILYFNRPGGRIVDIHFYKIEYNKLTNKDSAVIYSVYIPKNIFMKLIDALSMAKNYNGKFKYIIKMFFIFQNFFQFIKSKLIKNKIFYRSVGCLEPLEFLKEFKEINFYDTFLTVPVKSEDILKYAYGEDWKTPKKNCYYLPGQGLGQD